MFTVSLRIKLVCFLLSMIMMIMVDHEIAKSEELVVMFDEDDDIEDTYLEMIIHRQGELAVFVGRYALPPTGLGSS